MWGALPVDPSGGGVLVSAAWAETLVFGGGFAVFAVVLSTWFLWRARRLRAGLPEDVATAADRTRFEAEGTAERLRTTVEARHTGVACLVCEWEIQERNDGVSDWRAVEEGTQCAEFLLTDDTGAVRVDPEAATVSATGDYKERIGDRRYVERRLHVGDEAYVRGYTRAPRESVPDHVAEQADAPNPRLDRIVGRSVSRTDRSNLKAWIEMLSNTEFVVGEGSRASVARRYYATAATGYAIAAAFVLIVTVGVPAL